MKQTLFLKGSQQLNITPQLQQAIKLLQLSTLELQQEIQENLYTNPLLELDEDSAPADLTEQQTVSESSDQPTTEPADMADRDYVSLRKGSTTAPENPASVERQSSQSLQDYLQWQLGLAHLSTSDLIIGHAIIDSIDDDGLLQASFEEITTACALDVPPEQDEIEAVLHRIQRFDPPGVAARDLRECLLIQLDLLDDETEVMRLAKKIVTQFLPLVSQGDLAVLVKQVRNTEQQVLSALSLLKSLNPRPGSQYSQDEPDYIIPDILVNKIRGDWTVLLNSEILPKIQLAPQYADFISQTKGRDQQYLKGKSQEAKWFIRSLQSRHDTLLKVAKSIVSHQRDFFEKGPEHMRPLVLRDLAEEIGFHESTISRATNQKYLSCPTGVFELKYFFSSQVATTAGGEASSTAIKALISKLVDNENPQKPLSDSKLTALLKEQGIIVARRTVAKYREMQGIESSSSRKRFG